MPKFKVNYPKIKQLSPIFTSLTHKNNHIHDLILNMIKLFLA